MVLPLRNAPNFTVCPLGGDPIITMAGGYYVDVEVDTANPINQGIFSDAVLVNNGRLEFRVITVDTANGAWGVGLSAVPGCAWDEVDYSWHFAVGGGGTPMGIRENGVPFGAAQSLVLGLAGTLWAITLIDGIVRYFRDGVLIRTATSVAGGPTLNVPMHLEIVDMRFTLANIDHIRVLRFGV